MNMQSVAKLEAIVGAKNVLSQWEDRLCYSYDSTMKRGVPAAVVFPANTDEVAAVIRLANEDLFPVYPRGGGTGLSGGSVPMEDGIALVLTRMNRIKEINANDMLCVVEPGVITLDLMNEVEKLGLFYPPDPQSQKTCTIGGNVAENAGGPRAFKYGVTTDFVLGLEVVTPTGEIIRTGGRTVKNVTGFDLTSLITGCEGTLGVITEITLTLIPKPSHYRTALVSFADIMDASQTVADMVAAGVIPATLELMDNTTIRCVENAYHIGLPTDAGAILLIEVDGGKTQVDEDIVKVEALCRQNHCGMIQVAQNDEERENLWQARRSVSAAVVQLGPTKISEDATVPRSQIPEMVRRLCEIGKKYHIELSIYGHAGDGNLHPNIICDKTNAEAMERVEQATDEIFEAALELGGTLSGEHGIGLMKRPYMAWEMGEAGMQYLRNIKRAVDPHNILNPGKVI